MDRPLGNFVSFWFWVGKKSLHLVQLYICGSEGGFPSRTKKLKLLEQWVINFIICRLIILSRTACCLSRWRSLSNRRIRCFPWGTWRSCTTTTAIEKNIAERLIDNLTRSPWVTVKIYSDAEPLPQAQLKRFLVWNICHSNLNTIMALAILQRQLFSLAESLSRNTGMV